MKLDVYFKEELIIEYLSMKVTRMERKDNKPPYLIGLLCLLPLIGAFIGIALILYGIFRYKDRLLVIVGCIGVVITVGGYSLLFYHLKYGEASARSFAEISQKEITRLVKHIEFYKMQRGL